MSYYHINHVAHKHYSKNVKGVLAVVLRQFSPTKIASNPKTNPDPNPNPNQGAIFLGGQLSGYR